MKTIRLFCDGSVNPQLKIGFGAYFILDDTIENQNIKTKKFENTSSSKLELEVLLWAFENENLDNCEVFIYTDCQNILGLEDRREKLESNSYFSKTGKKIKNEELYKKFYSFIDSYNVEFIKVKGHKKSSQKDNIDKLFNLVDKASRKALRDDINKDKVS